MPIQALLNGTFQTDAPIRMPSRFPFLRFPLQPFGRLASALPANARTKLKEHLHEASFSVRLLRYWWAGQALAEEFNRLGRPLRVVDLGCERGWLKHFTPPGVVEHWIGLDWNPQGEVVSLARYDEVHHANFDEPLPLPTGNADAVVSLHVFEHLPRPGATMAEASRLLRPGGVFLGGAPTMPHWLARFRERYFRKRLQAGQLAAGGHITVLSPTRWRMLAEDAGLNVEFATGSHAFRKTGSSLENYRWWIRLNQLWGALFPSLGSECYLMARRHAPWAARTERLAPEDPHKRPLWIGLATAAVITIASLVAYSHTPDETAHEITVSSWLDAHQTGQDLFLVSEHALSGLCATRTDVEFAQSIPRLLQLIDHHPHAHVLVSLDTAKHLADQPEAHQWRIDSRLDREETDYLLLRRGDHGTHLHEYLLGVTG
jgi:SAM-dependent methyltransferase